MLVPQLTALVLLFDVIPIWYLRQPVMVLAGLGLLFPAMLRVPAVWGGISLLVLARVARLWPSVDNHHYLLFYWTLAIFLSLCLPRPRQALATSARWLVAFVFLWATLWKGVLSPDYLNETFYRHSLLTDFRFDGVTRLLGGLEREDLLQNRAFLAAPDSVGAVERPQALFEPPRFRLLVKVLTWSTLLVESGVALAFLLPWGRMTMALRHGTLIGFCVSTYLLAPVPGFGMILAVLGLAQVPADLRRLRFVYVAVFFLVFVFGALPWARLWLIARTFS